MPEEPECVDEAEAKAYAMETPDYMLDKLLVDLVARKFENDVYGFVTWQAIPEKGASRRDHFETFAEAVYTALQFAQTDFANEWLLTGRGGMVVLRMTGDFALDQKQTHGDPRKVGKLKNVDVYFSSKMAGNEFCAGCGVRYARGLIAGWTDFTPPPAGPPVDRLGPVNAAELEQLAPGLVEQAAAQHPPPAVALAYARVPAGPPLDAVVQSAMAQDRFVAFHARLERGAAALHELAREWPAPQTPADQPTPAEKVPQEDCNKQHSAWLGTEWLLLWAALLNAVALIWALIDAYRNNK